MLFCRGDIHKLDWFKGGEILEEAESYFAQDLLIVVDVRLLQIQGGDQQAVKGILAL